MFYSVAIISCRSCSHRIALSDIANSESYAGEEVATCVSCASSATQRHREESRIHRLTRMDPDTRTRQAHQRSNAGFKPDALALVETWALCDRCLAHLKAHRVARLKADGRMLRWMETDHGHPVAARQPCDACGTRKAAKYAVLRIARSAARAAG